MTSGRNARSRNCRAEARRYTCNDYGRSSGSAKRMGMPKFEPPKPLTTALRVYTFRARLQALPSVLGVCSLANYSLYGLMILRASSRQAGRR